MSIDMYLGQARGQAESVKNACNQLTQGYSSLLQSNRAFISSSELSGKSYDSAKKFFSVVIQPLVQGGEVLSDMTAAACQKFVDQYESEVDRIDLKSDELERRIQQLNTAIHNLEQINNNLPPLPSAVDPIKLANRRIIESLVTTKHDLERKLEKLLAFHASSKSIFSEVTSFHATLLHGLQQAAISWNSSTGTFDIPKGKDLEWANTVSKKYLDNEMKKVINKVPHITSKDWETIAQFAKENPDEEIPKNLQDYLIENKDDIISDLRNDAISTFVEQLGLGISRFGGLVTVFEGIKGPAVANSFVIVNPNGAGSTILKYGKNITTAGRVLGVGFIAAGFGIGMYDDLKNNDKTVGQAVSHNAASTGVGVGAGVLGALGVGLLVSNPGGWAILGGMAVGSVSSILFDLAYQNNFLGLQDGLDWAGNKIDDGVDWAGNKIDDGLDWAGSKVDEGVDYAKQKLDDVGEALSDVGVAINPMNWAW
jgi:hypothetical protein